jgi:hypothetical protein
MSNLKTEKIKELDSAVKERLKEKKWNLDSGSRNYYLYQSYKDKTKDLLEPEQLLSFIVEKKNSNNQTEIKKLGVWVKYDDFKTSKEPFKDVILRDTRNKWLGDEYPEIVNQAIQNVQHWYLTVDKLKELEELKNAQHPTHTQSAGKKRKPRTKKSRKSKRRTLKK